MILSKNLLMKYFCFLFLFFFYFSISAQDLSNYTLEAHYPFSSNTSDATSNYNDATAVNISYGDGGIYSNGIYFGTDTSGSIIKTPNISGFTSNSFALQISFKPEENENLILIAGQSWRWIQLNITNDGNLEVLASTTNGSAKVISTTSIVILDQWQTATILFNAATLNLDLYHDGALVASEIIDAPLMYQDDFTFSNEHGGLGLTYKGFWKNLKVYNEDTSNVLEQIDFRTIVVYPAISNGIINIRGNDLLESVCKIYNSSGLEVLKRSFLSDSNSLDLGTMANGLYYLKITKGHAEVTKKFMIIK